MEMNALSQGCFVKKISVSTVPYSYKLDSYISNFSTKFTLLVFYPDNLSSLFVLTGSADIWLEEELCLYFYEKSVHSALYLIKQVTQVVQMLGNLNHKTLITLLSKTENLEKRI